ncbi:MAG: haloacid dehalogenase-like hydrolase [Planctomycetaceae bacterium]|nr:haloacid dehalogenase-like hydrolase [Planctomycetaceae bacterium]
MAAHHLVLFDIDGTLLRSEGAGVAAMLRAFATIHGDRGFSFAGLEIAGALDGVLFDRIMTQHGLPAHDEAHREFQRTYHEELDRTLTPDRVRRMPGAAELAHALAARGAATGLLTGNYEHTAFVKIRAAGIDRTLFPFGAYGTDGSLRRQLTPVAMARAAAHHGRSFAAERVTVIGDTPLDVDCAKAHGCRSIGVATGPFPIDTLRSAGADLAVDSLADTDGLMRWILG